MRTIASMGTLFCLDGMPTATTERVRTALEQSGLDPRLARDLAKRHCFTRAKNRMRTDGLIDEVNETDTRWIWQLSRRYREENRLGYEYEASFWFDKANQDVGADSEILLDKVRALFARYGMVYLPTDVTKLVRRVFDRQKGMVPLRHHGAVYFVPVENRPLMDKVAAFIQKLGGDCITAEIGPGNTPVRNKALDMLVEGVKTDLTRITSDMRNMRESGEDLTKRKARHRWKELCGQLDRIKTFARSLTVNAEELISQAGTSELDLALVAQADLDVIAALAHQGRVDGALGAIARTVYEGELPPVNSPRVQAAEVLVDGAETVEIPVAKLAAVS